MSEACVDAPGGLRSPSMPRRDGRYAMNHIPGFLLVRTPEAAVRDWRISNAASSPRRPVYGVPVGRQSDGRAARAYRGKGRTVLQPWHEALMDHHVMWRWWQESPDALRRARELEDGGTVRNDAFTSRSEAEEVRSLLVDARDWEVVLVGDPDSSEGPQVDAVLGYEPAEPRCDHDSLVSDVMFFPRWYGPDPDGVRFEAFYEALNEHGLFGDPRQAAEFRAAAARSLKIDEAEWPVVRIGRGTPLRG